MLDMHCESRKHLKVVLPEYRYQELSSKEGFVAQDIARDLGKFTQRLCHNK